jgi:hypothetical protein
MINRLSRLAAGAFVVALGASTLIAQGGAGAAPSSVNFHPRYAAVHSANTSGAVQPDVAMPSWAYKFNYLGTKYKDVFIGTQPSKGAVSTKIPVDIIPIKLTYGAQVNDPTAPIGGGNSAVQQTLASPVFQKSITYTGTGYSIHSQYEDAFQKEALWNKGASASGYHVLFKTPTVKPTVSLTVPSADGGTFSYNGVTVIEANFSYFDAQIQSVITSDGIPANVLPVFITANSFLYDSGGCCIGGYHDYNGAQTYSYFNYLTTAGGFTEDVAALTHELGEWMDDPYVNNSSQNTPPGTPASCATNDANNQNPLYEVGDPLEGNANFGTYAYTVGGFTWHLQDLVTPAYFGAPISTSANHAETFQGGSYSVCQNGG